MFIHLEDLIIFSVLLILGAIGFRIYYIKQIKQWYSMYSEVNDKYRKAIDELSEYKRKDILNQ
jgi:hypothetical protein